MHSMKVSLCLASLVLLMQGAAFSAMVPMDSADFANKYEGDTDPVPNYLNNWAAGTSHSSDGNVLTYVVPEGAGGTTWIESTTWAGAISHDYTIETRLKINYTYGAGAFDICVDTGAGEAAFVIIGNTSITYFDNGVWTTAPTADNTDGFHTFRLAHEAGTSTVSLWRDGELWSNLPTANFGASTMYWLAGSGQAVGNADVDYYRWTDGAYAPIPEPATMGLLTLGGLVTLLRRKK